MKIGHFPSPYPDEMLYSICARFDSRAAYPNAKSTLQELFGSPTATVVIDLPNRLRKLAAGFPIGTSLTVNRLIDRHTLLPFYSAFLPPERVREIRKSMKSRSGPAAHMSSGVMASRIPTPDFLKFCPLCIKENEKQFGEAFWHRLHQLPGVMVCPFHQVLLENSGVSLRAGREHFKFIPAGQAVREVQVRSADMEDACHRVLLKIANDAVWLLKNPGEGSGFNALRNRYLGLLIDRGLATYTDNIHVSALLAEFTKYFSRTLLKLLHCEFTGRDQIKTNWLLRLVRTPKYAQHPLYHLLLIQFLGCTAEEFFRLPAALSFFAEGPWPCLNPVAYHYRKSIIRECKPSSRLRDHRPVGTFSCECGFSYARSGPDLSSEDRFRVGRMVSFGQICEAKLRQLWKDSTLSLGEVGRRLGVDPLTVRRHAALLKLPFSRDGRISTPLKRAAQLKGKHHLAVWEKKRRRCRSKWLSAMRSHRKMTLKALRHKLPREYTWLLQNDDEWLGKHKPLTRRRKLSTSSVDWKRRDAEYAAAVRSAASRLKDAPGRPVRVTKTAIGRALGAITLLRQKLHRMPLTAQVLAGVVEAREQYAVRRVWWAADLCRQEGVMPREWQLMMRANVYSLRESSAVECAVKDAMNMLTSKLPQSRAERAAS
jgi:hypothetical protein